MRDRWLRSPGTTADMSKKVKIRVAIIAPGPESEGGIRSVVSEIHPRLCQREDVEAIWIATHRTGSAASRIRCFLTGFGQAVVRLPATDVVHIHGAVGTSLLRKSVFVWLARACRCKVIYHLHATEAVFDAFFGGNRLVAGYARYTLGRCHRLVVLSDIWKDIVGRELPGANIRIIYNPVLEVTNFPQSDGGAGPVVVYMAHLIERKGYRDLIAAFARVASRVEDARLVFCGTGEVEKAAALCAELGHSKSVEFVGWVSGERKLEQLARATVFVLPSYDEGLPMGILECMSVGVPIITTPVGGVPDVLFDGENAMLVPPGDIEALAKSIIRLLTDEALRNRLRTRALADSTRFHPERITNEWVGLYTELTGVDLSPASATNGAERE
jgi:glycosyltransferase involved in cell wall biosynthesis